MIKISDGKIGFREFIAIILVTIGIKFTDTTPSVYFEEAKNAAWLVPIVSFIVILLPFLLLLHLLKKHKLDLLQLLDKLTGKVVGRILALILFLTMFTATITNARNYSDIVDTMFYPNTPVPFILLLVLGASYFIAKRGMETIGRTAWFFLLAVELSFLLLVIFIWSDLQWRLIFPFAGSGIKDVLLGGIKTNSTLGEIILLAAFIPFIRSFKEYRSASLIGLSISVVKITIYLLVFIMTFDYPTVMNMAYPYQQLTRIASIGEVITHMEAIFLAFWLVIVTIHFAIYLYLSAYLFASFLHIKKFEPLILPLTGMVFYVGLLPENIFQTIYIRDLQIMIFSGFYILLPIFLWIVDVWKGRNKNAESS